MTIIVEPYGCWQNRMIEQRLRAEAEGRKRNIGRLHPIEEDLMYLVREHQEPIRDTTLAHAFAKIPGYRNREERDGWIKTAWQHMTALIRMGKLQWSAKRKHVELAPPEKHQAWLARIEQTLASLAKPVISKNWFF
jgi:hypothetical protein